MPESQKLVLLVASGLSGLLVGSFLNVCIFRLPRNCMSIVKPRSRCPRCLHLIVWYDNLPVLSWLLLGGKCRSCRTPISPRYALIELMTGALYLYAGWQSLYVRPPDWREAVTFATLGWFLGALVVCTFIDLDFRILPDQVTISGVGIGIVLSALFPFLHEGGRLPAFSFPVLSFGGGARLSAFLSRPLAGSLLGAAIGWGTIYSIGILGKWVFRKKIERLGETEAMGFGDVKYMAMLGAVLGWKGVLLTLVLSCLYGSVFGIGKAILLRRMGYVPFGPFLSGGALTMVFWPGAVDRLIRAYMTWMNELTAGLLR